MPTGSPQKGRASVSQRKNRGFTCICNGRCTKWMPML
nr:MAG TPA: pro-SFTI-1, beta-sheet, random coil, HYDROLASE [Caudoviricetes sp.]